MSKGGKSCDDGRFYQVPSHLRLLSTYRERAGGGGARFPKSSLRCYRDPFSSVLNLNQDVTQEASLACQLNEFYL